MNPNAWTPSLLNSTMRKVKARYPEMPGVMMFGRAPNQGFANASNMSTPETEAATLEIIRAAGELMRELYPDPSRVKTDDPRCPPPPGVYRRARRAERGAAREP